MLVKTCTRCGKSGPASRFQRRAASNDGLTASCKPCLSRYDIERYRSHPQVRARHRAYARTEVGKESINRSRKAWVRMNPVKYRAITALGNAVRDGRLDKPKDCEKCGEEPRILHGHHDDYAKPLEVRWLCSKCHKAWHDENGQGLNA